MILRLKSFSLLNDCQIDSKSDNKRKKISERLKELSQLMSNWRLISIDWNKKWNSIVIVFNNGIISSIYLNHKNKVIDVYNDKYLINKLLSEHIVNVILRDNYILISYTQSKLTLVSITQPIHKKRKSKFKLTNRNSNISAIDLENGTNRRVERNLVVNDSGDVLVVWWQTGTNCVAPWSAPGSNSTDLANIFVYNFTKSNFELMSLGSISGHIFQLLLAKWTQNQLVVLTQSTDSAYVVNYCVLQIIESNDCLQRIYSIRIPLLRPCLRAEFSSALDKVVLLCDNDSISLFNIELNSLYSLHSSVNAFDFSVNPLDAIFTVADQFARLSIYDYALNTIHINYEQIFNDKIIRLNKIKFIDGSRLCIYFEEQKSSNITLITLPDVIDNRTLVSQYLMSGKCEEAIACLQSINWNSYSDSAYFCLNSIFNYLIKQSLNSIRESQLETTLATFLTPMMPIDEEVSKDYKLEVRYLAKRFFHHLIRYNSLDKAFLLAIDLKSRQLFSLLHKKAKQKTNERIANAALLKCQHYSRQECEQSLYPSLAFNSCQQNINNNNVIVKSKSSPVESSANTIGLPNPQSIEYKKYKNSMRKDTEESDPMPMSSILKPSPNKTKATIIGTKPVNFVHINPSDTYNKDIIFKEPSLPSVNGKTGISDPLYAISTKMKNTSVGNKSINFQTKSNSCQTQESLKKDFIEKVNNFERTSYSSGSSSQSRCSSSTSSSFSSTSASLSLPTPVSDTSPPPELPPKTYLMKNTMRAPERPPKKSVINDMNEKLDENDEQRDEGKDNSVPINLSHMKSGSKIECIHFGVV